MEQENKLLLRNARYDDSLLLLGWRNDAITRAMSCQTSYVAESEHNRWFNNAMRRDDIHIFIGEENGLAIGTARINIAPNNSGYISLCIAPAMRHRGCGQRLLHALTAYAHDTLAIPSLYALIRINNNPSITCFEKAGFKHIGYEGEFLLYYINMDNKIL